MLQQEYIKWRELQAGISSVEDAKRVVQTFVRETLFPKLKFIMSDSELEYVDSQCIAQVVCSVLKIKSEDWHIFKETVKDSIHIRSANSNSAMKKEFLVALADTTNNTQGVPVLQSILVLRCVNDNQVNDSYIFFCLKFLKCVVGLHTLNKKAKNNLKLSEIATPSDEAIALLLLDNSELRWRQEFEQMQQEGTVANKELLSRSKYTGVGQKKESQKGFTKRYGSWRQEAILKFNLFLEKVKDDRRDHGKWFDQIMLEKFQASDDGNKADTSTSALSYVKAGNDLFDEAEAGTEAESGVINGHNNEAVIFDNNVMVLGGDDDDDDQEDYSNVKNYAI